MTADVSADQLAADVLKERVLLAFVGPHYNHPGIPGAPEGVLCPRCIAERALDALVARLEAAERELKGAKHVRESLIAEADACRERIEAAERERDELYEANWPWEWVVATREKERREAAEAALALAESDLATLREAYRIKWAALADTRQALEMLWQHYLLPISNEQKEQVRRALAGGGTEEPT